jgi:hypothetical protein
MFLPLDHIRLPDGFRLKNYQWLQLLELWGGVRGGVEVRNNLITESVSVDVIERLPNPSGARVSFWYTRSVGSKVKDTVIDHFGLVGLSLLNLQDRSVIITEGVSDYLSAKMCFPDRNVLGFTSLAGNRKATHIVLSLFDDISYCCDNDFGKEINTGFRAGSKVQSFYSSYGKRVTLMFPDMPFNDLTEQFLSNLKFRFS